jgi:superfamily I DNA/RNA helicase
MKASNILVLAFTRKAADEMRTRIARLIGDAAHECTITTFHGLALRIIKRHYSRLGFKFPPALATSRAVRQELGICIQSWLQRNPSANCQRWTNDEYGETLDDLENDNETEPQGSGNYSHSQPTRSSQAVNAANLELETLGPAITHFRGYFKKARAAGVSPEQFNNEYLYVWKMYISLCSVSVLM